MAFIWIPELGRRADSYSGDEAFDSQVDQDGSPSKAHPASTATLFWQHEKGSLMAWHMDGANRIASSPLNPSSIDPGWQARAVVDMNGNGQADIVWQHNDGRLQVWYMEGLEKVSAAPILRPGGRAGLGDPNWQIKAVYDLNSDGSPDIIFQYIGKKFDGQLAVWLMDGLEADRFGRLFNRPGDAYVNPLWEIGAVFDLLGDGKPEVIWQSVSGKEFDQLAYWQLDVAGDEFNRSDSGRLIHVGGRATIRSEWRMRTATDLLGDGKYEILFQGIRGLLNGRISYWEMDKAERTGGGPLVPGSLEDFRWKLVGSCGPIEKSPSKVTMSIPAEPLYVGSYERVPVLIGSALPVGFNDLEFRVVEGPEGGMVSESKDKRFNPSNPEIILIAGHRPGKYTLEAVQKGTSTVLGVAEFEVTVTSPKGSWGPSFVNQGLDTFQETASAWGGGPSGLQNVSTNPTRSNHRFALIFVDTSDERFTADESTMNTHINRWRNHTRDGANIGGTLYSARRYYQESSYNAMDLDFEIFGPYQLDGNWDEVGAGAGFGGHIQAAITTADDDIDYTNYHTVLVVSQSVGALGDPEAKFAWPTATIGEWSGWVTAEGNLTLGAIQMPYDWTERDGRQIYATLSHEIGHNLGLGDLYKPKVSGRNVGGWDIMDKERDLPNYSLANKMRLGWIPESWVESFNFATLGSDVDQTITLQPASSGAPPSGRKVGAEVRVADGWNYYFEYRKDNALQIADRVLPQNNRVLGTDVVSGHFQAPILRPSILLLPHSSVLDNNQSFEAIDTTSEIYPVKFRATASGIDGTKADLRLEYGVVGYPDPSIEPWGAPPWQSPDIEIRNARNLVDPSWFNVPWAGNPNTVVAKVTNRGQLDAPGVRVEFYVKDFTVGGVPETYLGSDVQDIAEGATVEFTTDWTPPGEGHYCIRVKIPLYIRPGDPPIPEMTELNNSAQTNYTRFISATSSPALRKISSITVGNPYDRATRVYISAAQKNPFYRTYLEHKWLDLGPKEIREVEVMYEFVGELPPALRGQDQLLELRRHKNPVNLEAYVINPYYEDTKYKISVLGGANVDVITGKDTWFEDFGVDSNRVYGSVVTGEGKTVPGGTIILTIVEGSGERKQVHNQTFQIKDGLFSASLNYKGDRVRAYYLPLPGYSDATSDEVLIR